MKMKRWLFLLYKIQSIIINGMDDTISQNNNTKNEDVTSPLDGMDAKTETSDNSQAPKNDGDVPSLDSSQPSNDATIDELASQALQELKNTTEQKPSTDIASLEKQFSSLSPEGMSDEQKQEKSTEMPPIPQEDKLPDLPDVSTQGLINMPGPEGSTERPPNQKDDLPDLPAGAEIDIPKEQDAKQPTQQTHGEKSDTSSKNKTHQASFSPTYLIALVVIGVFIVGLGVGIPAIQERLSLINEASEPEGTQTCYEECDFTSLLCESGFLCGVIQVCNEETGEECEKKNVCYNPACKEDNSCMCEE